MAFGLNKKAIIKFFILIVLLISLVVISFKLSPYPSAWIIRHAFDKEAEKVNIALEKHVPKNITSKLDIIYNPNDSDAKLDLYFPENKNDSMPIIIWTHGGGWISGNKSQIGNYCKILASNGFVVASIDYSIAPENNYPKPVAQLNEALGFLHKNAKKYAINSNQFFLAGDSGGSHIAAQVATIITSEAYAEKMQIQPAIPKKDLAGMLLYCGPFDTQKVNLNGDFGVFLKTVLWSYSGDKNFMENQNFKTASVINYVTKDFPPTYISVGNADPLETHSKELANKLENLNVAVERLFFEAEYEPKLPHEYQFNLETEAGKTALKKSITFCKQTIASRKTTQD